MTRIRGRCRLGRVLIGLALAALFIPNVRTSAPSLVHAHAFGVSDSDIAIVVNDRSDAQTVPYLDSDAIEPVLAPLPTATAGPPTIHDQRYFSQTSFRIDNDTIYDLFLKRGAVDTFGFPISRTFLLRGRPTQFFQRHVVEIGPEGGARLINLLDPALMLATRVNQSTFPSFDENIAIAAPKPGSLSYDTAIMEYIRSHAAERFNGQPTRFFTTFNNLVTCADAYPNGDCQSNLLPGFNLEMAGNVTSNPASDPANSNFIYLRFQRVILHYDAGCRCTQSILLADYFKSVITGNNVPADLDAQMAGSPFYHQYDNSDPLGLNEPALLPNTNMQNAFEPQ